MRLARSEADPVVIQKTLEAVMAGDPAMQELMLGATVVVAYTNPTTSPLSHQQALQIGAHAGHVGHHVVKRLRRTGDEIDWE